MAVQQKAVEDDFEGFDRWHVDLQEETVFTGDAMALADLRGTLRQLGDLAKLARTRSDSDPRSDGQTDGGRVDLDIVATDDISIATATVIGVLVLTQIPTATEILGVALVIAGVAVHQERITSPQPRSADQPTPTPERSDEAGGDDRGSTLRGNHWI